MGYKENNIDASNAIGMSVRKMYYAIKGTIHKNVLDTDQDQQHYLNEKDMEPTQDENEYEQEMANQMNVITKDQIDPNEYTNSINDAASNPMTGNLNVNGLIGTPMHQQMAMMMGNNAMQNQMMMAGGMPNPMMNPMTPKNE